MPGKEWTDELVIEELLDCYNKLSKKKCKLKDLINMRLNNICHYSRSDEYQCNKSKIKHINDALSCFDVFFSKFETKFPNVQSQSYYEGINYSLNVMIKIFNNISTMVAYCKKSSKISNGIRNSVVNQVSECLVHFEKYLSVYQGRFKHSRPNYGARLNDWLVKITDKDGIRHAELVKQ